MKSVISDSVLFLVALLPLTKASPTHWSRGYTEPIYNDSIPSVVFNCGYDVPNWVINVGFGTPNQPARLLIDSTFDNTFVAGVMCHSEFCEDQKGPLYNAGKSSTSIRQHQRKTFDLGDGEVVTGDIYKDNFNFGDFTYDNFIFGKAFDVQGFPSSSDFAGVFGLSLPDTTNNKNKKRSISRPFANSRSQKPGTRKRSSSYDQCSFSAGIDYSLISGEIFWLNLPTCEYGNSPFYKTDLTCVTIDGVLDLKFKDTVAEFDTTVKNIEVPHNDLQKIHQGLHASFDSSINDYAFKCCDAKDLEISFAEYTVSIPASSWTRELDNTGELCVAKISESKTTIAPVNRWRLGTDFMLNLYTIFDTEQTGIALAKFGEKNARIFSK
ncbi:hypothetical protein INT47_002592 [Mucor saturninus]|uniref:Peptidase A1 domain-containing protein n=1 Tax=Mucor saturninus TaxID=64648 RepID=A0A8H7V6B4_9FUNG|nr:hypothetical protein INT47_002592 [Mucor saturninus]